MENMADEKITTEALLEMLREVLSCKWQITVSDEERKCRESIEERGCRMGWLSSSDVKNKALLLERRNAARILHEFIRYELGKEDLKDISKAAVLLDLYDCKVCTNHVAQVYLRGIMKGMLEHVFGLEEAVLAQELKGIKEALMRDFS